MRIPRLVVYPFLAAAYSVLALAAANPGEIPGLWVLTWPLSISLFVSLCAWFVLGLFIRDPDRLAFVTLMVVVLFASCGYVTIALQGIESLRAYASTGIAILGIAILGIVAYLGFTSHLVFRVVRDARNLTRFFTILTGVLAVWVTVDVLRQTPQWTNTIGIRQQLPNAKTLAPPTVTGAPDIYLIVLDKYTGSGSLKANFGFDNSNFESFLADADFVLPRVAQANYIYTMLSLAALLNYRYMDDLPPSLKAQNKNKAHINQLVEDSAVLRFLKERGYRFVFFPTVFPVTGSNRYADLQVPDPRQILSEFEIVWRRTTLAQPVLSWACQHIRCAKGLTSLTDELPQLLEWKFDQLRQVPEWPRDGRPLFVFAHLTVPHEPYVFNADCTTRPPLWPSSGDDTTEKLAYVAQIICLNGHLKIIVKDLIRESPAPPIILLQSDHGHGRMPLHIPELNAVTQDRVAERAHVFAAYYLPGANRGVVYDSITPVNVFRTVFRQYFQADLAPLPDKTYWSPVTNPFEFTRVRGGQRWPE